jgi:hypothetical protein
MFRHHLLPRTTHNPTLAMTRHHSWPGTTHVPAPLITPYHLWRGTIHGSAPLMTRHHPWLSMSLLCSEVPTPKINYSVFLIVTFLCLIYLLSCTSNLKLYNNTNTSCCNDAFAYFGIVIHWPFLVQKISGPTWAWSQVYQIWSSHPYMYRLL